MRDKHVQACPCITVLLCALSLWVSLHFYVVRRLAKYSHSNHTYIIKVRSWRKYLWMEDVKPSILGLQLHLKEAAGLLKGLAKFAEARKKSEICSTFNEGTVDRKNDMQYCRRYF